MAGMRVEAPGWRSESGVAHLLLVAGLAIAALYDSTRSSPPDRSQAGPTPDGKTPTIDAAAVARAVGPAVVDLDVSLADGGHASATGMVLTPDGEVVTNNHSIAGATAITARVAGTGVTYMGTVLGYDVSRDIAVLELA